MVPLPRRHVLILALAGLAAGLPRAAAAACPPSTVLFVCPAGTVKSAIAREALKTRARERGVSVMARSRGLHPEDHVSPGLAAHLKADGLDPAAEPARTLAPADLAGADIVIAFDEAAQAPGLERARAWDIPSWNQDYAGAKAALAPHIEALLDELAACPSARPRS